jgi:hypothetical protein
MIAPDSVTGTVQQLIKSIDQLRVTTGPAGRAKLARSIDASLALEPLGREPMGAERALTTLANMRDSLRSFGNHWRNLTTRGLRSFSRV